MRGFRVVHFDVNTKGGGSGGGNKPSSSAGANGSAKKLSNVTVVEGLRAAPPPAVASSVHNLLNGGISSSRSKPLPADTRQRLEDLARANTRPISRSVSVKNMAGSAPNLAASAAAPKRGQTIMEEIAAGGGLGGTGRLNNNAKTASVPSIISQQSQRRVSDLNLKNGGLGGGSVGDVSVPTLSSHATTEQQQHLPTSLSSDPSKKVRPRSFWANWWRF